LPIPSADTFFTDLADRVSALESFTANDPLSTPVAVARAKRYLPNSHYAIALHDLLSTETAAVLERISNAHFPTASENASSSTALPRLKRYDTSVDLLLQVLACIAYWGNSEQEELVTRCFRRIAEQNDPGVGMSVWLKMKRYPALLLFYGLGIAAIANGKYGLLKRLFTLKTGGDGKQGDQRVGVWLHDHAIIERQNQKLLLDRKEHTALSNYLFDRLRQPLENYLPGEREYENTFTWFEYFFGLASIDARFSLAQVQAFVDNDDSIMLNYWIPVNRFGWNRVDIAGIAEDELPKALQVGFFDGNTKQGMDKAMAAMTLADRLKVRLRAEWGVWF
jgi:hypothetical protein